jgi:hypothetical protein
MAAISMFLSNKRIPVTWVLAKDRQSCYWELESTKLHGIWHFTIKNGLKSLILAILGAKCKKMAAISTFLSHKRVPVTWVLAKDRQSCYWKLELQKLYGKWHFTIKSGTQKPHFGHFRYLSVNKWLHFHIFVE